jgi:hypothetical protein
LAAKAAAKGLGSGNIDELEDSRVQDSGAGEGIEHNGLLQKAPKRHRKNK